MGRTLEQIETDKRLALQYKLDEEEKQAAEVRAMSIGAQERRKQIEEEQRVPEPERIISGLPVSDPTVHAPPPSPAPAYKGKFTGPVPSFATPVEQAAGVNYLVDEVGSSKNSPSEGKVSNRGAISDIEKNIVDNPHLYSTNASMDTTNMGMISPVSTKDLRDLRNKIGESATGSMTKAENFGRRMSEDAIQQKLGIEEQFLAENQLAIDKKAELSSQGLQKDLERNAARKYEIAVTSKVNEDMKAIRAEMDELKNTKIDRNRIFKNADNTSNFGKRIGAAIAIALGGRNGPNYAMQMIDKAIERDMRAQQQDIDNKRASIQGNINMLDKYTQMFGTPQQAKAAYKLAYLTASKARIEELNAEAMPARIRSKYNQTIAAIDQKLHLADYEVQQNAITNATKLAKEQADIASQEASIKLANNRAKAENEKLKLSMMFGGDKKLEKLPVSVVDKITDYDNVMDMFEEALDVFEQARVSGSMNWAGAKIPVWIKDTKANRYDQVAKAFAQFIGKEIEGRMTDPDFARFKDMVPVPGELAEAARARITRVVKQMRNRKTMYLNNLSAGHYDVSGYVSMMRTREKERADRTPNTEGQTGMPDNL